MLGANIVEGFWKSHLSRVRGRQSEVWCVVVSALEEVCVRLAGFVHFHFLFASISINMKLLALVENIPS